MTYSVSVILPFSSRSCVRRIYPWVSNSFKAAPMLFLWRLKDLAMIGIGALIAVFAMAQTGFTIPLIATIVYGFLAIRFEDTSILDFIKYAVKYFFVEQQEYRWKI